MDEKEVGKYKITHLGVIDEDKLYGLPSKWKEEYDIDLAETEYKDKGSLSVKWEGEKDHTKYIKSTYEIKLSIDGRTPVELIEGDKKVKKTKAKVKIEITSKMITDKEKKLEETGFMKKFEKFYNKYIVKDSVGNHKKEIEKYTKQLYKDFKSALGIEE